MSTVAITQHETIERGIAEALDHLSLDRLIRGKLVAVKPNETWASADDTTGVTQPDTLRAVLRYIKEYSPRQLIVTGGAGAAETEEVFRIAGLRDVVEQEQVIFVDHNRPPFTSVQLNYGVDTEVRGPQRSVMVHSRVLEYETLIAVNQLKLHETATVTLALKNIAMSFPAADYYGHPRSQQRHRQHFFEDMHSFIAAMAKRFPIHLAITVGHPAMIGTGPLGGPCGGDGSDHCVDGRTCRGRRGRQIIGVYGAGRTAPVGSGSPGTRRNRSGANTIPRADPTSSD